MMWRGIVSLNLQNTERRLTRNLSLISKGLSSVEAETHFGSFPAVKLSGLPYDTIPKDITIFLGGLQPLDLVAQFRNGQPTGCAAILFRTLDDAKAALKLNNKYLGTRYIRVMGCRRDEYFHIVYEDVLARQPRIPPKQMTEETVVLKLQGLSFETLPCDVVYFCRDFVKGEDSVIVAASEKGIPTGIAYVQLSSIEDAERARDILNNKFVGIRKIRVTLSTAEEAMSVSNMYF